MYYIDEVPEIDIHNCVKHCLWLEDLKVLTWGQVPPTYLPITLTNQRYGTRIWFECHNCNRRVTKMYYVRGRYACRHCFGLKYRSQYKKDAVTKRNLLIGKLSRYDEQKRTLWYGGYKTQFGKRYYKYLDDIDLLQPRISNELTCAVNKIQESIGRLEADLYA